MVLKNENKLDEMVDILAHHYQYVPSIVNQEKKCCSTGEMVTKETAKFHSIIFGGDQMTAARTRTAMKIRVNSNSSSKKFTGFVPAVEDWHTKANFLGVSCSKIEALFFSVTTPNNNIKGYIVRTSWKLGVLYVKSLHPPPPPFIR